MSIHLISGCRTTASIPAFQAGDGGSTPLSRSNGMNLTNSVQQRHRILCIFWFLSRVKGCHGLGCPVVSAHYFDRVIEKLLRQLLPDKEFPCKQRHTQVISECSDLLPRPRATPIALYIPIAGCLVKIHSAPLPWFYSRPITCRKPESGQNGIQLLRMMNCFGVYLLDIAQ